MADIFQNKDSLYCFCCKLFSQKTFRLSRNGFNDWKNCSDTLTMHENSPEHTKNMGSWKELESRIKKGQTIDKVELALINTTAKVARSAYQVRGNNS